MELKFYLNDEINERDTNRLNYLREQVNNLKGQYQPEQRTKDWYDMRNGMLTASDWGTILGDNPYSNCNNLILKKCGHEPPFIEGEAIKWGVKYEDVAIQIYEYRNKTKVIEFGLIKHPKIEYLGASPDGITDDGVMVEIKCPFRREITGEPPIYYYDQVQGQLEVCELDRCDFLECKLAEYECEEDYLEDNQESSSDINLNKEGNEKGFVVEFLDMTTKKYKYEYGPLGADKETIDKFTESILETYRDNDNFKYIGNSYWYLVKVSCVPIYRDYEWFDKAKVKLEEFWNTILSYREKGVDELLNKKKKVVKKIYVDTTIEDYSDDKTKKTIFNYDNYKLSKEIKEFTFSDDENDDKDNQKSTLDNEKSTLDNEKSTNNQIVNKLAKELDEFTFSDDD